MSVTKVSTFAQPTKFSAKKNHKKQNFTNFSPKNLHNPKTLTNFAPFKRTLSGAIAQLVEQRTENPCVPGSIPGGTTKDR